MSSPEPRRSRRGPAWTRVLLLMALLLGLGTMHTLGHLQHEAHASTGFHAPMPAEAAPATHTADGASGTTHTAEPGAPAPAAQSTTAVPELDPTSVCLALGAFTAVLLGVATAAFTPWLRTPSNAGLLLRRPPAPRLVPERPSLARLQVLRV